MKTSEKIYINPEVNNYNSESPFTGSVEYVRSDIAEQITKDFYIWITVSSAYIPICSHQFADKSGVIFTLDELFTEFNIRKK